MGNLRGLDVLPLLSLGQYISAYGLFIIDLSLRSIKTNNWSVDNFKKHVTSMSCTLELAILSGDTGLRIPFLTPVN